MSPGRAREKEKEKERKEKARTRKKGRKKEAEESKGKKTVGSHLLLRHPLQATQSDQRVSHTRESILERTKETKRKKSRQHAGSDVNKAGREADAS